MSLPTLYQALFDRETSSEVTSVSTVYHILQVLISFNITLCVSLPALVVLQVSNNIVEQYSGEVL